MTPAPGTPDIATPVATAAPGPTGVGNQAWEAVKTIAGALGIAVVLRSLLIMPFFIPSGSMIPSLLVGDYLFVTKWSYGYSRYSFPWGSGPFDGRILGSAPARGDVAVFKDPKDNSTDIIKRVIGLPGDQIQVKLGQLYINGAAVPKVREADLVVPMTGNDDCSRDFATERQPVKLADGKLVCRYPRFRETLPGGRQIDVLDTIPDGPGDNTDVYIVPAESYFMMGDNRDDSEDSRFPQSIGGMGYVPFANLVGHARVLWISFDGNAVWYEPWTWVTSIRWNRIGSTL